MLTVLFLTAYYVVETTDPAEYTDGVNIPVVCFPKATEKTRYCAQCGKSVVGLDHHCTWLNTCIGIQNYVPFISLVTIGFTQMSMQVSSPADLFYCSLDDHRSPLRSRSEPCCSVPYSMTRPTKNGEGAWSNECSIYNHYYPRQDH